MGKHCAQRSKAKNRTRRSVKRREAPRALKTPAASMAGVLVGGLLLAPCSHWAQPPNVFTDVLLTAATVVFIDGNNYANGTTRMDTELQGDYYCTAPCTQFTAPPPGTTLDFINNTAVYPGTLGLYNGFGAPSGDQAIADGQAAIDQQVKSSSTPVTVVAYSEGAVAASHEVTAAGLPANTTFVLIGDAERPNGGLLARFPAGIVIPLLGITAGGATSSTGAPAVMVTQQYDGIADAPAYPINVLADLNAILGFHYLHSDYNSVDPNAPGNIVTTSGNLTDILIPAAPGALPMLMPLGQVGVPQPILVALDPAVRALIETGYDRTSDPAQQVGFALLPPPSAWAGDVQSIATGVVTTAVQLPSAVVSSTPVVSNLPLSPLTSITPAASPLVTSAGLNSPKTLSNLPTVLPNVNMASGNKINVAPTKPPGGQSNAGNALQGAATNVTNAIGSVTSSLTKGIASAISSHNASGSSHPGG